MTARWLTRAIAVNRVVAAGRPGCVLRCGICQAAADAVPRPGCAAG